MSPDHERSPALPQSVMASTCWSFNGPTYSSRADFDRDVRQYQIDITDKDSWRTGEVVIRRPEIAVRYECWVEGEEDDEQIERILTLSADNREFFTAGELLIKVHNAVAECELGDHHFFEGFELVRSTRNDPIPVYEIALGS